MYIYTYTHIYYIIKTTSGIPSSPIAPSPSPAISPSLFLPLSLSLLPCSNPPFSLSLLFPLLPCLF